MEQVISMIPWIVSVIALFVSVAALVVALVLFSKLRKYLSDSRSVYGFGSEEANIRDEIVDVFLTSPRVRSSLPKPEIVEKHISVEVSEAQKRQIVEEVIASVGRPKQEAGCKEVSSNPIRYASAYNPAMENFASISESPNDSTVFELRYAESMEEGTFTLFKGAYDRIREVHDFLEGACESQGNARTISILNQGKFRVEDGKSKIETKLSVKFE